jgi:hypothetical protein
MRLWPFGKSDEELVEFVSRVVTAKTKDGSEVRGKLTLHFATPTEPKAADDVADRGAGALMSIMGGSDAAQLLGHEEELAQRILPLVAILRPVRHAEIVALHVVGGAVSDAPQTRRSSSAPPPAHRRSSSQILAVREGRLIPLGATPEIAGGSLVPLVRDAAARVLVGALRSYDLVVVRHLDLEDGGNEAEAELVPMSTAAPGQFATERASEIERWREKLGDVAVAALTSEAATVVCFFLAQSLEREGIDHGAATRILENAASLSFVELAPLTDLPRYFAQPAEAAETFVTRVLGMLKAEPRAASGLVAALGPVLASVRDEFALAATQVKQANLKI